MYTVKDIRFETRDDYGRKTVAERVLKLIEQGESNSPLFIDGAWGSGKSEFCYKLFHFLKESNEGKEGDDSSKLMVSYINSFAGDYQNNPFMLIVQAIYNSLITKDASAEDIERVQGILSQGISFAKRFFAAGFRSTSFKIAPPLTEVEIEINGGDFIDNVKEGIKQENKKFEEAFFEELESFRQQSEQLISFKRAISEALDGKKLVLIIDELDRCRPDYALELLENIKHIFDIKGLFIIFSANKSQLGSMIRKKYGYDIDAEEYLEKFYQKEEILSSAVPASDSINGAQGIAEHLSVFCANLKNQTRNDGGQWTVSEVNSYPFVRDILGTMQTRRLEKVANYLNVYSESIGIPLQNYNEAKIPLIILGVFILVSNKSLLIGIENEYAQSRLIKFLEQLEIGGDAKSIMMSAVRDDLKIIGNTRDFSPIDQQFQSGSMMRKVATTFLI